MGATDDDDAASTSGCGPLSGWLDTPGGEHSWAEAPVHARAPTWLGFVGKPPNCVPFPASLGVTRKVELDGSFVWIRRFSRVAHVRGRSHIDIVGHRCSDGFPVRLAAAPWSFYRIFPIRVSQPPNHGRKTTFADIRAAFPAWVVLLGACLFVYAIVNFALFMVATEGGSRTIQDGKYLLLNHGKLIRELSAGEYRAFGMNEVRGFSGHWMVFCFAPCAYFLFRKKPAVR